ncbi:hypothetical protein HAX54_037835 [Datura stramonium]|uniref:Uncharacterized protein n=1 Tax=Datura stramonium TaxID=4076 RepID=A0ABS8SHB2_DATST|nr:hypothetical protein [Datura stramonium]
MAPKVNKGKGVASSNYGNKRSRGTQEAPNEDASMPPQPPRRYGLCWVTKQEDKKWFKEHKESKYSHELFVDRTSLASEFARVIDILQSLGLNFVFNDPSECNLNMMREFFVNLDPKEGLDVMKEKEPKGIYDYVLSISQCNVCIDNILSHLYGMQMLRLRMSGVIEELLQ